MLCLLDHVMPTWKQGSCLGLTTLKVTHITAISKWLQILDLPRNTPKTRTIKQWWNQSQCTENHFNIWRVIRCCSTNFWARWKEAEIGLTDSIIGKWYWLDRIHWERNQTAIEVSNYIKMWLETDNYIFTVKRKRRFFSVISNGSTIK